ncbi:MAG: FAD-dependent oxidoreductase, partial [Pseudomonadota bacterium]
VVLAAGALLGRIGVAPPPPAPALAIEPVRGQAARVRPAPQDAAPLAAAALPVIQAPGLFIVAHADGTLGVGSTHEPGETAPGTDAALDAVLSRAAALLPMVGRAGVVERWSGLRPRPPRRAAGRLPLLGPVPGSPGLWIAAGGQGIGLALAHVAGAHVAAALTLAARPAAPWSWPAHAPHPPPMAAFAPSADRETDALPHIGKT